MTRPANPGDRCRDIWIGDVLEVWHTLGLTTAEQRAAAAEALGFDVSALRRAREERAQPATETVTASADTGGTDPRRPAPRDRGPASTLIPSTLEKDHVAVVEGTPSWLVDAKPLAHEQPAHAAWRPPRIPLLKPHWTRHIMTAVAAVSVDEGSLDERRLIEAVTSCRPIVKVPRRQRLTLRRGVQVLVDRGEAMLPFQRDAQEVVSQLRTVVGRDRLVSAIFVYTPASGDVQYGGQRQRVPWKPPAPGTPILLITDLGISKRYGETRGADVDEWLEFAARCHAAGCPAVALVPRAEADWPGALRKVFTIIPWDHRTNVSVVLRFLRSAAQRG